VWDAALVLCKYFENVEEFPIGYFTGKKIIELGAGTGCVGLVLSRLGGKVTLTDQKQMLPLLEHNTKLNNLEHKVQVVEFNWGEETPLLSPPYDIILLSDLIAGCYSSSYQALVDALWWLTGPTTKPQNTQQPEITELSITASTATSKTQPIIIMSYEKRSHKELEFFRTLSQQFTYKKVDNSKLDPLYQSDEIGIFIIKRKN